MTSDDQHFLDIISSISNDIHRYSEEVCDFIDSVFERSALPLREALYDAHWWPETLKPVSPHRHVTTPLIVTKPGVWGWMQRNRAASAVIIASVVSGTTASLWLLWDHRRKHYLRKRRARRGQGGAKTDVVVVAGTADAPLSRSVILDLERRGFIVYVVAGHTRDEELIREIGKGDIIPLPLDVTDTLASQKTIQHFLQLLQDPQGLALDRPSRQLHLAGLILIPDPIYSTGPIEVTDLATWSDAFNARLLNTIATTQAFLPLIRTSKSRILLLTPSIASSLRPPFYGLESTMVHALGSYIDTLAAELRPNGASVGHLKIGAIQYGGIAGLQQLQRTKHGEVMAWPSGARTAYARDFIAQQQSSTGAGQSGKGAKGSPLREVNNAVFDALVQHRVARVTHVGRGSLLYDLVGQWCPPGIVGRILGWKHSSPIPHDPSDSYSPTPADSKIRSDSAQWEKMAHTV